MTADPLRIRAATASDIPAVLLIQQQAPAASQWSESEYKRLLSRSLLLVADTGQEIAGFLCATQAAGEWELENIAVATALQRRGIAGELLRSLIDHVRLSGAATVFLEVRESNLPARRFYEKMGLVEAGRRRQYYQAPVEDAVLYRLDLKPTSGSK